MNNAYKEFIDFSIRHNIYDETAFKYIRNNAIYFDYLEKEKRANIGYYYFTDGLRVTRVELYIPFIKDDITTIINIHEYIHGLTLYKKLGKRYKPGNDSEALPLLYEKIYLSENPSKELEEFTKYLNNQITENSPLVYRIALNMQPELFEYYQREKPSFTELERKAKTLARKYQISKR